MIVELLPEFVDLPLESFDPPEPLVELRDEVVLPGLSEQFEILFKPLHAVPEIRPGSVSVGLLVDVGLLATQELALCLRQQPTVHHRRFGHTRHISSYSLRAQVGSAILTLYSLNLPLYSQNLLVAGDSSGGHGTGPGGESDDG